MVEITNDYIKSVNIELFASIQPRMATSALATVARLARVVVRASREDFQH